jgi:hypothetical protein
MPFRMESTLRLTKLTCYFDAISKNKERSDQVESLGDIYYDPSGGSCSLEDIVDVMQVCWGSFKSAVLIVDNEQSGAQSRDKLGDSQVQIHSLA